MSLTRISFSANAYQGDESQTNLKHIREGFRQLLQAIKDGNLTDAQQAYTLLTDMMVNTYQILSGQLKKDYTTIGQALRAGDIAGARKAVSVLHVDLQTIGRTGDHHAQTVAESQQPSCTSPSPFTVYPGDRSATPVGTRIDIMV